jgi:hypothetical protein
MIDFTKILATALTLIVAAEQVFPQSGLGSTKKQIVLNGVQVALQATTVAEQALGNTTVAQATSLASTFVDQTVLLLNKAGVFKTATGK